jgi:hypothetical protein
LANKPKNGRTQGRVAKKLGEEDSKLLDTIFDLCHAAESMEITASFEYGFRLGAALMVEVLADREELVRPKEYSLVNNLMLNKTPVGIFFKIGYTESHQK